MGIRAQNVSWVTGTEHTTSLLLHGKLPQNLRVVHGTSILFPQSLWVEDIKRLVERNAVERNGAPSSSYQKWGCFQRQRVAGVTLFAMELMFVLLLKVSSHVAGEIDQWLWTLAALQRTQICVSVGRWWFIAICTFSFRGSDTLPWLRWAPGTQIIHISTGKHSYIKF